MKAPVFIALALSALLAGCASGPTAEEQAAMAADARKASGALIQELGGELKEAIATKGPDGAIGVCKERAPQIAAEVSQQFNFETKRVSPKNRNPAGIPDGVKARLAADYPLDKATGHAPGMARGIVSIRRSL